MHDGLLEDLLVANIGLDQSPEARNDSICFLIELEEETQRREHTVYICFLFCFTAAFLYVFSTVCV